MSIWRRFRLSQSRELCHCEDGVACPTKQSLILLEIASGLEEHPVLAIGLFKTYVDPLSPILLEV